MIFLVPGAMQRHKRVHARLRRAMALFRRTGIHHRAADGGPRLCGAPLRGAPRPGKVQKDAR